MKEIIHIDDLEMIARERFALNGIPFTGKAFDLNENGKIIYEQEYADGLRHGIEKEFDDFGNKISETSWFKNMAHGYSRTWSPAGILLIESFLGYGILLDEKKWNEFGDLVYENKISEDDNWFKIYMKCKIRFESEL